MLRRLAVIIFKREFFRKYFWNDIVEIVPFYIVLQALHLKNLDVY